MLMKLKISNNKIKYGSLHINSIYLDYILFEYLIR